MIKVHMNQTTNYSAVAIIKDDELKKLIKPHLVGVPDDAIIDICLRIPGGGDWSNMVISPDDLDGGGIQLMAHWTRKNDDYET